MSALCGYFVTDCEVPLGVEDDNIIRNEQMSASTQRGGHRAEYGRLYGDKAWRPAGNGVTGEWIQVMFTSLVKVTYISTQGRSPQDGMQANRNQYVTQYKVLYSNDGQSWMYIKNAENDEDRVNSLA